MQLENCIKKKNNFKYNILENFPLRHCHKLCKPFLRAISPLHYPLLYTPNVSEDSMIFQENKTLENTYRCVFPCGVNILFKSRDEWSLTSLETLRIPGSGPNNFAGYFSGYSVLEKHIYIYINIYTNIWKRREDFWRIDPWELEYKCWYTKVISQVNQRLKIEWHKAFNQR